jgi:hypothetical protein
MPSPIGHISEGSSPQKYMYSSTQSVHLPAGFYRARYQLPEELNMIAAPSAFINEKKKYYMDEN